MLAIGSRLIILGEVGEDPEGAEGDLVVRKAAPSSILDLKTSSISRPFVVSTKTEQGLLQVTLPLACKYQHYFRNSGTYDVCPGAFTVVPYYSEL